MLMILTLGVRFNAFPGIQSNANRIWSARHEPRTAAGGPRDDPVARLRCDGCFRAGSRAVRRAEGNAAAPDGRLDLGRPDGHRRRQLILDPRDPLARPLEPDPSLVDLHADRAADRGVESQAP